MSFLSWLRHPSLPEHHWPRLPPPPFIPGLLYSSIPKLKKKVKHLAGLILNKTVDITCYGTDQFNNPLGVMYLDGKNINLEMIRAGFAEVCSGKHPQGFDLNRYREAEAKAREAKIEMWSQLTGG